MTVEQRHQQCSAGFCLAGNKTGALLETQFGNHKPRLQQLWANGYSVPREMRWACRGLPAVPTKMLVIIGRARQSARDALWVRRNHSTNLGKPSLNFVVGLYPSNFLAFEMSAYVRGISPGCSARRLIFAFFPTAFSIAEIRSFS